MALGLVLAGCDNAVNNPPSYSYTEGDVNVQGTIYHYYFSDSVEGLQKAANDNNITLNPPLKNATWVLNTSLDNNVKQAMASKNATYCGTLIVVSQYEQYIIANRKEGNDYYITAYQ